MPSTFAYMIMVAWPYPNIPVPTDTMKNTIFCTKIFFFPTKLLLFPSYKRAERSITSAYKSSCFWFHYYTYISTQAYYTYTHPHTPFNQKQKYLWVDEWYTNHNNHPYIIQNNNYFFLLSEFDVIKWHKVLL